MSNAAERGGRLCLFVARCALSLALQALNGTPQSEVTPHASGFFVRAATAPSNYKTLSRQKTFFDFKIRKSELTRKRVH
ncbi:hypothetical protein A7M10_20520 [Acinetobacter baumannii]|nr:hypothetical protein A7M10_20520 [Acinetobacter baumannii]